MNPTPLRLGSRAARRPVSALIGMRHRRRIAQRSAFALNGPRHLAGTAGSLRAARPIRCRNRSAWR